MRSLYDRERIARLPKWAQGHIETLERRNTELQKALLRERGGKFFHGDKPAGVYAFEVVPTRGYRQISGGGERSQLTFQLGKPWSNFVEVQIERRGFSHDAPVVSVRTGEHMMMEPCGGNSIHVWSNTK